MDLSIRKRNPHMPPESRSRDGNGDSREGAKARRGKAGLGFVFFAASRAAETVRHAKARRGKDRLGFVFFAASRAPETVRHAKARRREKGRTG